MEAGPSSPCVKLCVLDPVSGYCIGCGRTGDEIAQWASLPPSAQEVLTTALPERLRAMTSRTLRAGAQRRR